MIYLDHNATTPVAPEVREALLDTLTHAWANPSSSHAAGQAARRVLADARARVATFLGCQAAELVFTSGATEANHLAVRGALALGRAQGRRRWLLSAVEHPGLLALAEQVAQEGGVVQRLPVTRDGVLDLDAARAAMGADVALVSVMGANNETGVLMPLAEVAALAHAAGALLHVDATQLAGKAALDFAASGAHLMATSAHKLQGPKGVGALVVRRGVALPALLCGRQERHRRGGTENLPAIAGFAAACELAAARLAEQLPRQAALRDRLEAGLRALPGTAVYGAGAPRLANTCCVRFATLDADVVLGRLERAGVLASSGAACSAGGQQPSHVLLAMGASAAEARAGVRFSLGGDTRADDIEATLAAVQRSLAPLLAGADAPAPAFDAA
jgi:cysteine desulfurase